VAGISGAIIALWLNRYHKSTFQAAMMARFS
jgi:hypothetical protein